LRIAKALIEAGSLVRELLGMRITMAGNGRVRLGADGFGDHDDPVIAVALSYWRARRTQIGLGTSRLTGIQRIYSYGRQGTGTRNASQPLTTHLAEPRL
jgi:hypothetical protein